MKTLTFTFMTLLLLAAFGFAGDSTQVSKEAKEVAKEKVEKADKTADKTVEEAVTEAKAVEKVAKEAVKEPEMITTESGLRYQDLVVGEGVECTNLMRVDCHYTLWFADSTGLVKGKRFQSSKDGGKSFQCTIGQRLIAGWSEGMIGMKEGGTRLLYVPWELGYGANSSPGGGPGKQNLIFEIDFLKSLSPRK
jgi:FKBP-type peptidyl-prolyl cis-trans isomerase FkpA